MTWKEFLKPNWKKILLIISLFAISSYFLGNIFQLTDILAYGFPLAFYTISTMPCPPGVQYPCHIPTISYFALIINIVFWYLIACGIIFGYEKKRSKK